MSRKVLVIDDSEPVFETVRDELAKERVELRLARDRQGGLVVAEEWLPDLILLDGELADGPIEIIRALKNAALTQDIPVMLLTDVRSERLRARAFEMGASDSISIPIDPAELRARVRAALHTRRLAELLARKAMVDGLTGLWNRTYFDTRLS